MFDLKYNDDVGRYRIVRRQLRRIRAYPVGKLYNIPCLNSRPRSVCWLDYVEAASVKEEGMIAEYSFKLRNHRMAIGNDLGFELIQSSLDQCGIQLHRRVPLLALMQPALANGQGFKVNRAAVRRFTFLAARALFHRCKQCGRIAKAPCA